MLKTIKIEEETHSKLMNCGIKGETFDTIINKLLDNNTSRKRKNGKN